MNTMTQPIPPKDYNCVPESSKNSALRVRENCLVINTAGINVIVKANTERLGDLPNPKASPFSSNGRAGKSVGRTHLKSLARDETCVSEALCKGVA